MNEFISFLLSRRSCRKFRADPLERVDLEIIAEVACHAPSARNRQLWQFTVVSDSAVLEELYRAVGTALGRENYDFYGAAAMILCSNDREHPYGREDCACAMQNIYLAAHALDIGAVWINQLTDVCDDSAVRAILTRLGVPQHHVVYGCAALGYADGTPSEKTVSHPVVWN